MSAAGGAGSSSPRVKLSDEILNCSVCRDEYTIGGIKGPCALSCGHTFCRECLRSVRSAAADGVELKCPVCRKLHPRGVSRNYSHESVLRSAGVAEGVAGGGVGGGCDDEEEAPPAARERPSTVEFERFLMASLGGMMAQFGGAGGGAAGLASMMGGHFSPSDMPFLQFHGAGGSLISAPKHCMHCRGCAGSCGERKHGLKGAFFQSIDSIAYPPPPPPPPIACPFSCPPCHPRASCSSFPNPAATQRAYDTARRLARGRPTGGATTSATTSGTAAVETVDSRTDRYAVTSRASGYAHCDCCLGGPALCSCDKGCPRTAKTKCTPQSTSIPRASSLSGGGRLRMSMVTSRDAEGTVPWAPSSAARRVPAASNTSASGTALSAAVAASVSPPPPPPTTTTTTTTKAVKGKGKGKVTTVVPKTAPVEPAVVVAPSSATKITKTKVKTGAASGVEPSPPPLPPTLPTTTSSTTTTTTTTKRRRASVVVADDDTTTTGTEPKESVAKKRRK